MNELSRPDTSMAQPAGGEPARLDWVDAAKGIGIILVVSIHPGQGNDDGIHQDEASSRDTTTADTLMDLVR